MPTHLAPTLFRDVQLPATRTLADKLQRIVLAEKLDSLQVRGPLS